jgi:transcriptional regulator GlxA family with amidase domain
MGGRHGNVHSTLWQDQRQSCPCASAGPLRSSNWEVWLLPGNSRRIVVVAYDGVGLLDVTGPLEVFTQANVVGASYDLIVAGLDGGHVVTRTGTKIVPNVALREIVSPLDTLIVAGGPDWENQVNNDILVTQVARVACMARRVTSVCTGAFVLAAAGLLDGRRATTHWRHLDQLEARFPLVQVDRDAIFLRDGTVTTSAGVSTGIDLALSLVEDDFGPELARSVARELVVFMQRPGGQSQFSIRVRSGSSHHESLRRLIDQIVADPAADYSLATMSNLAGFSVRHLCRLFREEIGLSAARYVESIRVELARELLETTDDTIALVATKVGFNSMETMRRAFLREIAVTPAGYRERFQTTAARPLTQDVPLKLVM